MTADDVDAVYDLGRRTLFPPCNERDDAEQRHWTVGRFLHVLRTDPHGCRVLDRSGEIAGVSMAIVREHVWGLTLLTLDEQARGQGHGRALFDAALGYGAQRSAEGWIVLSSENPAAMRLYTDHAGMTLKPTVAAVGIPDLSRAPDDTAGVDDAGEAGIELADAIGREQRGAGHGPDLAACVGLGARLPVYEDRAFALAREGQVVLLGARDAQAAALALWGALLSAPRGSTAYVTFLTGAQQWAIRTCLSARMPLSVDSPVMTRGRLGPMAPYIPGGSFL